MKLRLRSLILTILAQTSAFAATAIFWVSGPVQTGETVLVTGSFPQAGKSRVRVAYLQHSSGDWQATVRDHGTIVPLVRGSQNDLMFVLPNLGGEGVYGFQVDQDGQPQQYGRINLPEIWWTLAQSTDPTRIPATRVEGNSAQPGSTVIIFGRNLTVSGRPGLVQFSRRSGQSVTATATPDSPYALTAKLPVAAAPGEYAVIVGSDGESNPAVQSEPFALGIHASQFSPPYAINLANRGVNGDGKFDNSAAFAAAITEAAAHQPAVINIPSGTFALSKPLILPPGTYLRGQSPDETALFFISPASPPPAWISGTHNFGLENLSVFARNQASVISSDMTGDPKNSGHVRLSNVRVRSGNFGGPFGRLVKAEDASAMVARLMKSQVGFETLRLSGPDILVENCDLLGIGRSIYLVRADGALINGNKLYAGIAGWYNVDRSQNVLFERNRIEGADLLSTGGTYSVYGFPKHSKNIYTTENIYARVTGNNGEAFTSDGGGGAYFGGIAQEKGADLTLKGDAAWGADSWEGALVAIISGTGLGQWRTLERVDGRNITMSSAFQIPPDDSSQLTIAPLQLHYIFYKNQISDAGTAIQFYGSGVEQIADSNQSTDAGGFDVTALKYQTGVQPEIDVQLLHNVVAGVSYSNAFGPSAIQVSADAPSAVLGLVIEGNLLKGNSLIRIKSWGPLGIKGVLLEKNGTAQPQKLSIDINAGPEVVIR